MSGGKSTVEQSFFGRQLYVYLACLAAIPVWLLIHAYVKTIEVQEDDTVATAATAVFMAGIFTGRYITQLWTAGRKPVENRVMVILVIILVACTSWLFFHADFPLKHRAAINLLLFWLPFMAISLVSGMLVKLLRVTTQHQVNQARAGEAHTKSELSLLQSQLSPHFLFNTLNNLYGLSLTQHEKVPPLLLKLAELLRYSVYEASDVYVPLQRELGYIRNYIDFEKIRLGERLDVSVKMEAANADAVKIAPMLLIVFIENAFKHSKNSCEEKIYIEIVLRTWANSILFSVKNSRGKNSEENEPIDKHSGFGLASVNKRLALLYPGEYELTIQNEETFYNVLLQLKIK